MLRRLFSPVFLPVLALIAPAPKLFAASGLTADQFQIVFPPLVQLQASLPHTFNLTNSGSTIVNFNTTITGPNAADFTEGDTCLGALAPQQSCTVSVSFAPHANGVSTATLSFSGSGIAQPLLIPLQGVLNQGGNALLTVITQGDAGSAPVNSTAAVGLQVTSNFVRSTTSSAGATEFTVLSIQFSGPAASDYSFSPNRLLPLYSNNGAVDVSPYFKPSALGQRQATMVINTTLGAVSVALNGIAIATSSSLAVVPAALDFGSVPIGILSSVQAIELTSTGSNTVTTVTLSGANASDFAITAESCSYRNVPCSAWVSFTPSAAGPRTATLTFNDSAPGSPHSVLLTGKGVATGASLLIGNIIATNPFSHPAPTSGVVPATDFGAVALGLTGVNTNYVLNTGNTNVSISETLTGANAADFTLNPNHDPSDCLSANTLAPNQVCIGTVGFNPSAPGLRNAVFTIADSASGVAQNFPLTGVGVAGTKVIVLQTDTSPQPRFPAASVGTTVQGTIQFSSGGTETVTLTGAAIAGPNASDFNVASYSCPSGNTTLAQGDTCTVQINFAPAGQGYRLALLYIFDNAQNGYQILPLTGVGTPATAIFSPASPSRIDFGSTAVGSTAYSGNVTFTNTSPIPVHLSQFSFTGPNASLFALYSNACPATLQPGASCQAGVEFTPSSVGVAIAFLTLANDSAYGTVAVGLAGVGFSSAGSGVVATPSALTFTSNANTKIATVQSAGGVPFEWLDASISGPDASHFIIQSSGTPAICARNAGSSPTICTIQVYFTYNGSAPEAATLNITTDQGSTSVSLLGNNTFLYPMIRYQTPVSLTATVGHTVEYTEIIYQVGTAAASIALASPSITGPNAADFAAGPLMCDLGVTCTLPIFFTPSHAGSETATVNIVGTNGTPGTATITLTGAGQP